MKTTGTLGIGTITLRKKQYLASIKPLDDAIVLDLMRFADEVLAPDLAWLLAAVPRVTAAATR